MTYIVIETQTNGGTTSISPPEIFDNSAQAESKFHLILSYAAVSSVEEHAAMIITQDGAVSRREVYRHPVVQA